MIVEQLARRGISSQDVLTVIENLPRERFVPEKLRNLAYSDQALAIDCGQTISQPYIVGLMTQALELTGQEHVLEIGTGSGYQTAVLAVLAHDVATVERHPELSQQAATTLDQLGFENVKFIMGDGTLGWPEDAPYDRIIVAAAAQHIPPALWEQLREGGILVIPLGDSNSQVLQAVRKVEGQPQPTKLSGCRFVPFVGAE
jgi:protein-L-isoaspartate(D-aspartate) O-methyltransferase